MRSIAACLVLLLACGCQPPPDFVDAHGHPHRFADYRGKWVVVNYWATWCGPCNKEIPELNELAKTHRNKLVLLGVDYDLPKGKKLLRQIDKMKIEFPVFAADPRKKLGIEEPEVLPTTFIFAPGLKLKEKLVGAQTAASVLAAINRKS